MPEETTNRNSRKRLWMAAAGVVVLAIFVALGWYVSSPAFTELMRRKVVAGLEDATGGRVEMVSFGWNLPHLAFEANGLTIHGLEPAGELPYAHIDRVFVRLHVISFFERQVSVRQLQLDRPVVHIIVNPDETTNVPGPKIRSLVADDVQQLFDLAIARADIRNGALLVNQRKLPLDFAANDVIAAMTYDARNPTHHYAGSVKVGKIDLKYGEFRDIPASANLEFSLWEHGLTVQKLEFISEQSKVNATGELTNFDDPRIKLSYNGMLNVAQLGAVTRSSELRGGTLAIDGNAAYSAADGPSATGRITGRDLAYMANAVAVRGAELSSNFAFSKDRLQLTQIAARMLGGAVAGDADIKNVATQQEGSARLRVSSLSLTEAVGIISSRAMPLDKLNADGRVSGSVNLAWNKSPTDALVEVSLDIAAPTRPVPSRLPVTGNVRGKYDARSGRLDLAALNLTLPHTHVEASGVVGASTVALKVNANTTNLSELQPFLTALGNASLPLELAGAASFDGTVSGKVRAPQVAGHLQATDFTYVYTPAPSVSGQSPHGAPSHPPDSLAHTAAATPHRIHIDQFAGDVQYSQSGVSLHEAVMRRGEAQLAISGSATLDKGTLTDGSAFQLQASMHNADISDLQQAAGVHYPIAGKVNLTMQAAGTVGSPHGNGQFSLAGATFDGRPIKAAAARVTFVSRAVELEGIHLQAVRGAVSGSAGYDFDSRAGNFDLSGHSIDLAELPALQSDKLQPAGVMNFTAKGSGTLDNPVINAHFQIAALTLNGDKVGNLTADAVTKGKQLTLTARSEFPKAWFTLDGQVQLEGDMPGSATLEFSHLDVNPFLPPHVREQVTRQASLDGTAEISGPFKEPRLLHGSMHIQQFSVEVQHVPVTSDGVELSFADEAITVQHCTVTSQDTNFTLTGIAHLDAGRRLDMRARGLVSLKVAETLRPDVTSYGTANVDVSIKGTTRQPDISGQVEIAHAGFSMIDMPAALGDLNGTLAFNQGRLDLVNVTGRMGGGRVKLGGYVTYGTTLGFDVTTQGTDIRFRYSGFSVTSDQMLHLTGTSVNASVTGSITVTRFAQIPSTDVQAVLAQVGTPARVPNPKSPLNNLHLDVRIQSSPELTLQTTLAKLSGDVDLRLRGTAAHPVLLGRVNIAQGEIKLAGTKYQLERGDINFLDPVRIDPVLDMEATTRVRDYDITIGLHGTMERLNTTYRSDPPLSTDDIISLLAFGRTQAESALGTAASPGFAESASGAILSAALNQAVTNRVSRIFGSSLIRINPSLGGPENDPNARLTLQQQVSNDITFTYITNLARSAQEVIQFEYNINSEYTLQGIRDENGVVSFDLLIRKRRR